MKKLLIAAGSALIAIAAAFSVVAARFQPTVVPNTYVGLVPVGGLTRDEAARKLRVWWESEKLEKLSLSNPAFQKPLPDLTPGALGVALDDQASVQDLPMTDLAQAISEKVGDIPARREFEIKYKEIPGRLAELQKRIRESVGQNRSARVTFEHGGIVRQPEVSGFELDPNQLMAAVADGIGKGTIEVPLKEAAKVVSDEELKSITDVVSQYSTRFPSYQTSRNTNIRLAAEKLNGCVLMPGQELSFNGTVGRRTAKGGFREAPVLKNGQHAVDIGGGICQVSTTLYNAALLADLKIVRRNNHSLPSAYVALGRDATVDYGNLDLVIANSTDKPIAICSTYEDGRITFRILGRKDPSIKVKIETAHESSWARAQQLVVDRTLAPGARKTVERGSDGHSIDTYRIVYKDGVEVKRELVNHSTYGGAPCTIAYNPATPASAPSNPAGQAAGQAKGVEPPKPVSQPPEEAPPPQN